MILVYTRSTPKRPRSSTLSQCRRAVEHWVSPHIGGINIGALTPAKRDESGCTAPDEQIIYEQEQTLATNSTDFRRHAQINVHVGD